MAVIDQNNDPNSAQQNQQQGQQGGNVALAGSGDTGGTAAGGSGRLASYSSGNRGSNNASSGSGRFTNLSKYINANQGAGDRLATGITNQVNKTSAADEKTADTSASAVRQGIQSAQDKLNTGTGYLNTVNAAQNTADTTQDQGVSNIVNNDLSNFTNARTGNMYDTAALNTQNANAVGDATTQAQNIQNRLGQVGSEPGRFNLLKETFGNNAGNTYTTGQQKLDNLFLQSSDSNNISNLQKQLSRNLGGVNNNIADLTGQTDTISGLGTSQSDLASGLTDRTNALQSGYNTNIAATADTVNAQRQADQTYAQDQYAKLKAGQAVDQKFLDMMGLTSGAHVLNSTLADKSATDYLNLGASTLQGADQLANTSQRGYYDQLAQLAGIDPTAYSIGKTGTVDPAVAAGTGDKSLSGALAGQDINGLLNGPVNGHYSGADYSTSGQSVLNAAQNLGYSPDLIQQIAQNASTQNYNPYNDYLRPLAQQSVNFTPGTSNGFSVDPNNAISNGFGDRPIVETLQQLLNSGYFNTIKTTPSSKV